MISRSGGSKVLFNVGTVRSLSALEGISRSAMKSLLIVV